MFDLLPQLYYNFMYSVQMYTYIANFRLSSEHADMTNWWLPFPYHEWLIEHILRTMWTSLKLQRKLNYTFSFGWYFFQRKMELKCAYFGIEQGSRHACRPVVGSFIITHKLFKVDNAREMNPRHSSDSLHQSGFDFGELRSLDSIGTWTLDLSSSIQGRKSGLAPL